MHTHTHTHRETQTQRERERDRETQREREIWCFYCLKRVFLRKLPDLPWCFPQPGLTFWLCGKPWIIQKTALLYMQWCIKPFKVNQLNTLLVVHLVVINACHRWKMFQGFWFFSFESNEKTKFIAVEVKYEGVWVFTWRIMVKVAFYNLKAR